MTAIQLLLAPAQAHRNRQRFADHYLDTTLPQWPEWQALLPEATAALAQVAALLHAYTPSPVEAQLEEELVKPILRLF